MRLVITLSEIQQFISNQYQIDIELNNIGNDKIEAVYIDSVVLIIKEVKEDLILLHYEVNGLAHIVAKITHFFMKEKLKNIPIEWDSKNEEVKIDLKKFPEMKAFLQFLYISELHFVNDSIVLVFYERKIHKSL